MIGLALVFILGFVARWVAWQLNLPSILLLLIFGLAAGPWLGWLDPDQLFGNLLLPFVSLSVALILFEGGLSLNFRELPEIGGVVRNMISIGALLTWVIGSFAAWLILELSLPLAVLIGAVFVVTGPTVVIPLLLHVRPTARVRNTIKWEGILNDPIGAILAVLVFEAMVAGDFSGETAPREFLYSILTGIGVGVGGAGVMLLFLGLHWVPRRSTSAFSIAMVVSAFIVSNDLQPESGTAGDNDHGHHAGQPAKDPGQAHCRVQGEPARADHLDAVYPAVGAFESGRVARSLGAEPGLHGGADAGRPSAVGVDFVPGIETLE